MAKIRDADFLELFTESDDPVLSTREIADALDVEPQTVINRLNPLEEQGILKSKKAGPSKIWWHTKAAELWREASIDVDKQESGVEVVDSLDIPGDHNT